MEKSETEENIESPLVEEASARPRRAKATCPVIGLGASAGGLEAFEEFFSQAPADAGMAYVLVQHLDPNHASLLSELVARRTSMPVRQIADGVVVEPDHVYCIPPNASLAIVHGRLRLSPFKEPRGLRRPIDSFFESLAEDQGDNAACIVLSGTGGDGVQGLRAMKEAGGLTLAQDPGTARYDGMPRGAVGTGVVDHILSVARMPSVLATYFHRRVDGAVGVPEDEGQIDPAHQNFLEAVCRELRAKTGHDFSAYKPSTLLRRIRRRMQVLGIVEDSAYLGRLVSDTNEAEALLRDLLINVTAFFRDAEPFAVLQREVIAKIVEERAATDNVRVWVPGCSSGEEAYSIAMLLDEALADMDGPRPSVSIFATDIDEAMLAIARAGVYPQTIVKDLPERFRDRYLIAEEHGYLVSSHIRDMVRFSSHNVIKDPPFSRLDLISCRNLLIYLGPDLQSRVLPVFHYGLKDEGFLFLGPSETIGNRTEMFEPIDRRARVFRRRGGSRSLPLELPLEPREQQQGASRRMFSNNRDSELRDLKSVQTRVLDRYAPPHVLVDGQGHVVHSSGRTGKYLELASGAPSTDILQLAREDLRGSLRRLVGLARQNRRRQVARDLSVTSEFGVQPIDLVVDPVGEHRLLIVFQDVNAFRQESEGEEQTVALDTQEADGARERELEQELRETQERLRSTIEELEISNEELKTSNEEMMSMNEELQSANEELSTVNEELKNKLDQLAWANNDLQNFLESTRIAVIFLDKDLRLRTFTPASTRIFNFIDQDKGRPLSDVSSKLDYEELVADARRVLSTLVPVEREVSVKGGQSTYVIRVLPYRTVDDVIDGVVFTFTEVSRLKKAESDLRASERHARAQKEEIETLYRTAPIGMALVDADMRYHRVNQVLADINGTTIDTHEKRALEDVSPALAVQLEPLVRHVLESGETLRQKEIALPVRGGTGAASYLVDIYPYGEGERAGGVGFIIQDVTDIRRLAENQRQLMNELQHRVKNTLATVQSIVSRTARNNSDIDAFVDTLKQRIASLARTHNLLTATNWTEASLYRVVQQELAPYRGVEPGRVAIVGEDVALSPRQALALTMAFHELTTNAAKHGALSDDDGKLSISWELISRSRVINLRIRWVETGGPKVLSKGKPGFGRLLLEKGLAHDLQGSVSMEFRSEGVACLIEAPLSESDGS